MHVLYKLPLRGKLIPYFILKLLWDLLPHPCWWQQHLCPHSSEAHDCRTFSSPLCHWEKCKSHYSRIWIVIKPSWDALDASLKGECLSAQACIPTEGIQFLQVKKCSKKGKISFTEIKWNSLRRAQKPHQHQGWCSAHLSINKIFQFPVKCIGKKKRGIFQQYQLPWICLLFFNESSIRLFQVSGGWICVHPWTFPMHRQSGINPRTEHLLVMGTGEGVMREPRYFPWQTKPICKIPIKWIHTDFRL